MDRVALVVALVALPAVLGVLLLRRRAAKPSRADAVTRQHIYLFQGGRLGEAELEATKATLRRMLDRGEAGRIEAGLRAGTQFAVQVRALAEVGGATAGDILERQLRRRFSKDPVEQSWYWLDLANGLRRLHRTDCLPTLLQSFPTSEAPLRHFLAAETACFPGFQYYLRDLESGPGRAALLVLHQALLGLRTGVQPQVVAAGRLGEAVECVWEQRHRAIDPLAVRVLVEAVRLLGRAGHAERTLPDSHQRDDFRTQVRRIAGIEAAASDYIDDARGVLLDALPAGDPAHEREVLRALIDLKADTAAVVCPLFDAGRLAAPGLAIESLAASANSDVGPWLCERLARVRRPGDDVSLAAIKVLRHFPSEWAERSLLRAAQGSGRVRLTALGSLGWWEPIRRDNVLACLRQARFDRRPEVRHTAEAALARLGERQALQWLRQQFVGEHTDPIHRAIQFAADEGVLLLWPDLDRLADAEDADIAAHACEALEQMRESFILAGSPR